MACILLISLFGSLTDSNSRLKNICNAFGVDNELIVITSDFSHGHKQYKVSEMYNDGSNKIKEIRIHVPAYRKNLSFRRIFSHIQFAKELKKYLALLRNLPDLVYCAMPTSSAAFVAGRWCKKNNIPFVIDVIDIWPDSLIPLIPCKKIINSLLLPWKELTNKAYRLADYISAESDGYAKIAHEINPKVPYSHTYLGIDCHTIARFIGESKLVLDKPNNEVWIAYGGSLGQSYDFDVILRGLSVLRNKQIPYKMWFVGDGEKAEYIRDYALRHQLNVEITGRLPYKDLLKYLSYCDIALNSFKEGTRVVHSYKFNDYIATGCFVLNNLSGETADMIDKYRVGYNYNSNNFSDILIKAIDNLHTQRLTLSHNLQNLIADNLDTSTIYGRLYRDIESRFLRYADHKINDCS